MEKRFLIERIEYGWFEARIRGEDAAISICASCFEDFVEDFMTALLCALGRLPQDEKNRSEFTEEQETQHVRWKITGQEGCFLFQAITCDVDCEMSRADLKLDQEAFLGDFFSEFERVLKEDGPDGFRENWYHDFPGGLYSQLKKEFGDPR